VAFKRGKVVMLRAPSLAVLCEIDQPVLLLAFSAHFNGFIAGTDSGKILLINLDHATAPA
jgi:hypothetical protein